MRLFCDAYGLQDCSGVFENVVLRIQYMADFLRRAMHPKRSLIKGVVCGVRVEEIEDPLLRGIGAQVVDSTGNNPGEEKLSHAKNYRA